MFRSRAFRLPARAAIAGILVLAGAVPASAVSPTVTIETAASPFEVTVNLPIAYVVNVTNGSNKTLKFLRVAGQTSEPLTYLGALPASCSQAEPVCDLSGLPSKQTAQAIFYFQAPATPRSLTFTAFANFDGQTTQPPASYQHAVSAPIETIVLAQHPDRVFGHSFAGFREFSTGLGSLNAQNKHGTTVVVPTNAEVRVRDLPASDPLASCAGLVGDVTSLPCFGEASHLSIGGGAANPFGIKVVVRWDATDLPSGMTEKKLRIVHIFDPGVLVDGKSYELVTEQCTFAGDTPTNLPCLDGPPLRLGDKDIQATLYLLTNATVRGW